MHTLQNLVVFVPRRVRFHELLQLFIQFVNLCRQMRNQRLDRGPHATLGEVFAHLLRRLRFDELPPSNHQRLKLLRLLIRNRSHRRTYRLCVPRNQLRIKQVCLGQFPQRATEIANLPRIHHSDGNRRLPQRTQQLQFVASGRFQDHELWPNRCQILQQVQMPRRRIVETALHSIGQHTDLQSLL